MASPDPEPRPGWDEYYLALADMTARRSPCLSRQVGCVIVSGGRIIATGYNGPPSGIPHCGECARKRAPGAGWEVCRAIHAEQNAILSCARSGTAVRDATLYCTCFPCSVCARMILNLDVRRIVFRAPYPDQLSRILLAERGFALRGGDGFFAYGREGGE
ncbi:MAG: cytidine/deoxycytidylate deaminase family protein [Deltaproteobacteria bacterium]|jgi:dCMP deaminase|nr:cytidine/deoxycytidylate deaminase family protein [Deltaproteobacteria bacterium]